MVTFSMIFMIKLRNVVTKVSAETLNVLCHTHLFVQLLANISLISITYVIFNSILAVTPNSSIFLMVAALTAP